MEGEINHKYVTTQHDMFATGLMVEIGVNAFAVWSAIKYHADFVTGAAYPGMRHIGDITGLKKSTVHRAVNILIGANLCRVIESAKFKRQGQTYVARERLAVRIGNRIICYVVVDYVPLRLREKLNRINQAMKTGEDDPDAWTEVDIIPGDGFVWDATQGKLHAKFDQPKTTQRQEKTLDPKGLEWLKHVAPTLAKDAKC